MKIKNTVTNRNFGLTFCAVFLIVSIWPLIYNEQIRIWSLMFLLILLDLFFNLRFIKFKNT